jgi:hypothetical protein
MPGFRPTKSTSRFGAMASGRRGRWAYVEGGAYPDLWRARFFLRREEGEEGVEEEAEGDESTPSPARESALRLAGERDVGMGDGAGGLAVADGVTDRRGLRRSPPAVAPPLNMKLSSLRRPWKVGCGHPSSTVSDGGIVIFPGPFCLLTSDLWLL